MLKIKLITIITLVILLCACNTQEQSTQLYPPDSPLQPQSDRSLTRLYDAPVGNDRSSHTPELDSTIQYDSTDTRDMIIFSISLLIASR